MNYANLKTVWKMLQLNIVLDIPGKSDEVGWILEIDIDKVKARKYYYKELVDALVEDDFLKQEYKRERDCLQKLLDNKKTKGRSIFDRLI